MSQKKRKRKKQRDYTLADLHAMVEQLGGRLFLEIVPAERADDIASARQALAGTGAEDE